LKAKALELLHVLSSLHRRVAGNRLPRHWTIVEVNEIVLNLHQLPRVRLDVILMRPESPGTLLVRIEFNDHRARAIHLSVTRSIFGVCVARSQDIDTGNFADLSIKRYQRPTKAEHQHGDDKQLAQCRAVTDTKQALFGFHVSPR
jgi:hypothetical protein